MKDFSSFLRSTCSLGFNFMLKKALIFIKKSVPTCYSRSNRMLKNMVNKIHIIKNNCGSNIYSIEGESGSRVTKSKS